ncbi:MAG: methyltransferase [Pseudomonadota bacterium]
MKKSISLQKKFQYIEDLSTAYWSSEILFAALNMDLFTKIDQGLNTTKMLAKSFACNQKELFRFLNVLDSFELIKNEDNTWHNSKTASTYLVSGKPSCMKDFFLYRQYMQPEWMKLIHKISPKQHIKKPTKEDDYKERTLRYVQAMDTLVKEKITQIVEIISKSYQWNFPVLDIGGGAGSFGRAFINSKQTDPYQGHLGILFDLLEVIEAAKTIYPDNKDWKSIKTIGDDFRTYEFTHQFGLVIMSNFLHVYSPAEAEQFVVKAVHLLKEHGVIIVHDYFPDRKGTSPHKGGLYDINMMLNTFNGECHKASVIKKWLSDAGIQTIMVEDLSTDSSIIIAQ